MVDVFWMPRFDFYQNYWAPGSPDILKRSARTRRKIHDEIRVSRIGFSLCAKRGLRTYAIFFLFADKFIEDEISCLIPWSFEIFWILLFGVKYGAQEFTLIFG